MIYEILSTGAAGFMGDFVAEKHCLQGTLLWV